MDRIGCYRVFIATPGGLEKERSCFRDSLNDYNESEALSRGAMFRPVGWEITTRTLGRPQELINEEIRACDYFVMIVCDRWGTQTEAGSNSKYSSGTEEEFYVALNAIEDHGSPMKELIVLFKGVDEWKMSDPGPQLQKVIDFKRKLEDEKKLLFKTFDSIQGLEKHLRKHLALWLRYHEFEQKSPVVKIARSHSDADDDVPIQNVDTKSTILKSAQKLALDGKRTEAELMLAQEAVKGDDLEAIHQYGHLLLEQGRFDQAGAVFTRLFELAKYAQNKHWRSQGMTNLGLLEYSQKKYDAAEEYFTNSLELIKEISGNDHPDVAVSLNNLAAVNYSVGRLDKAAQYYKEALDKYMASLGEDHPFVIQCYVDYSHLLREIGDEENANDYGLKAAWARLDNRLKEDMDRLTGKLEKMKTAELLLPDKSGRRVTGPEPVQYTPTGTGLIDPVWRWEREHPFRG